MARYDTYQSNAAEAPLMRKWIFRALLLSLVLHGGLFAFFQAKRLDKFGNGGEERLAPVRVVMKQVTIPAIPDTPERLTLPVKAPNVAKITVPTDKPEVQEVRIAPQTPEVAKPLLNEKPKLDNMSGWDALAKIEATSRGSMDRDLSSLAGGWIKEGPRSANRSAIIVPAGNKLGSGGTGDAEGIPGMQNIDAALARTGPLPAGDKIGLPGGALFDYNDAMLRPDSIDELQKLGELVQRNPKATFGIEGHTDAVGPAEYNQRLSERRAEAVKQWLVENLRISAERIQTVGFGSSKLLISPDKTIEEQQPNRRVEIVIKTNRK